MKKFFVAASALMLFMTACDKNDTPTPPPSNNQLIKGQWSGDFAVRTGFIAGEEIETKDSTWNELIKHAKLTFKQTAEADSIVGVTGETGMTQIKGTYQLKDNDSLYANLSVFLTSEGVATTAEPVTIAIAGIADVSANKLVVTQTKLEAADFGDQVSDSTVTVFSFNKAAN